MITLKTMIIMPERSKKILLLYQISENARKLSNKFKTDHKSVPWQAIFGLRNRIVHDYGNVNLDIVYSTIKDDIPKLLEMLDSEL